MGATKKGLEKIPRSAPLTKKEASLGMTILMISPVSTARGGGLLALPTIEVKVTIAAATTFCGNK